MVSPPDELRFDGQVAVISGAGGGLGRQYALLLASRGACIVVNDIGGSVTGDDSDRAAADSVADEIIALGGRGCTRPPRRDPKRSRLHRSPR
ncbi:MAG: hypothetical protein ACXWD3_16965, partial [Mycobacterium sp.]